MFKPLCRFVVVVVAELFGEPQRGKVASQRRALRARPRLEALEGRVVPAVYYWAPQGGSTAWGTASNWIVDYQRASQVPGSSDDVVFASSASLLVDDVFTAVYANYSCTYSGSGGAIAQSITLQSGYTPGRAHFIPL